MTAFFQNAKYFFLSGIFLILWLVNNLIFATGKNTVKARFKGPGMGNDELEVLALAIGVVLTLLAVISAMFATYSVNQSRSNDSNKTSIASIGSLVLVIFSIFWVLQFIIVSWLEDIGFLEFLHGYNGGPEFSYPFIMFAFGLFEVIFASIAMININRNKGKIIGGSLAYITLILGFLLMVSGCASCDFTFG